MKSSVVKNDGLLLVHCYMHLKAPSGGGALCAGALALSVAVAPCPATLASNPDEPMILDLARVFPAAEEDRLNEQLSQVEDRSGIRVRLLTETVVKAPGKSIASYSSPNA